MDRQPKMQVHTRNGTDAVEEPFEKPVILPITEDRDPTHHAWADARFATDTENQNPAGHAPPGWNK